MYGIYNLNITAIQTHCLIIYNKNIFNSIQYFKSNVMLPKRKTAKYKADIYECLLKEFKNIYTMMKQIHA